MVGFLHALLYAAWCSNRVSHSPCCHFVFSGAEASRATPPATDALRAGPKAVAAMAEQRMAEEISRVNQQYHEQSQLTSSPADSASQQLWFEARRVAKRGPPTPAFSSTGLATPSGSVGGTGNGGDSGAAASTTPQTGLFQPITLEAESAIMATAYSAGINAREPAQLQQWMAQPLRTRGEVLETIRQYHTAVIRPELYNLVTQVEQALAQIDDRVIRQSQDLQWMVSENRQSQRQYSALSVILTGSTWSTGSSVRSRTFRRS